MPDSQTIRRKRPCGIAALDNIQTRLYVDKQCVKFMRPLFESGTSGVKGSTQPIIPNITESYGASNDFVQEDNYPVCTIKNFPTHIRHTIHYALDDFNGLFNIQPTYLKTFINNPSIFKT